MDFEEFKYQLLDNIKNRNGYYITILEQNEYTISEYLARSDRMEYVKSFINGLIDTIIESKNFPSVEYLLKHPLMYLVSEQLRQSDILTRTCDKDFPDKSVIDWILTKDINIYTQDDFGRTALMTASKHYNLGFLVDLLLKNCTIKYSNIEDNNGNTALFYAVYNIQIFKKILDFGLDYNHVNMDGDNVLMYACKQDRLQMFNIIIKKPDFNIHQINNIEKNLAMLLVEKNRYNELKTLIKISSTFCVNYKNRFNDTLVSVYINRYRSYLESNNIIISDAIKFKHYNIVKSYALTFKTLNDIGCDFNITIDEDGNTPIIFLMLTEDYASVYYLLTHCSNVDLTIKNKYGVNASYLMLFINMKLFKEKSFFKKYITYDVLIEAFLNNPTFDYSYLDSYGNSLLIHSIVREDSLQSNLIKDRKFKIASECNSKKENFVIIAAKLGKFNLLNSFMTLYSDIINVNHQDALGNTALFYAVKIKDRKIITLLMKYKANPEIPNVDGVTALDAAKEMNDPSFEEFIQNCFPSSDKKDSKDSSLNTTEENDEKGEKEQNESKKSFSITKSFKKMIGKKEEDIDEKLDNYIKNYRITSYQKEYDYLLKYEFISNYRPSVSNELIQSWIYEFLCSDAV